MSCDRCIDIHTAQREGKTSKQCECDCHYSSGAGTTVDLGCTCGQTFTGVNPCPVHGTGFTLTSGNTCGDDATIAPVNLFLTDNIDNRHYRI